MESFMPRSRQWGRVVSVLFALLALARARQQSEVESDVLRILPDIYTGDPAPFVVTLLDIPGGKNKEPPRPLLIAAPNVTGKYPVVQFQHGFHLQNKDYTVLLLKLASYGFIAVAPQISGWPNHNPWVKDEVCEAVSVINWLEPGLNQTLSKHLQPLKVEPDLPHKLAVVGHSRGGKVVFGIAKGFCETTPVKLKLSAIVGLDPVDGPFSLPPFLPDLKLSFPILIVGGGRSTQWKPWPPLYPCGPAAYGHKKFFDGTGAPAFYFVALNNGHMDYLNGECPDGGGCSDCVNGPNREDMRTFSANITAAFLEGYLSNTFDRFCYAYNHYDKAPVTLQKPDMHGHLECLTSAQEA